MKNIFKSIITTFFGILIMILTLGLIFVGSMDWVWEGIAGMVIGTVLILSPDTLVTKIGDFINKFTSKKE